MATRPGPVPSKHGKRITRRPSSSSRVIGGFHDNFFGGEPYGGREVVFFQGRPVWMAVYYGHVDDADANAVYSFLRRALREAPPEFPVRGPVTIHEDGFSYRNSYEGDVTRFWGEETIHAEGRLVYTARYGGGLVDRRSGD